MLNARGVAKLLALLLVFVSLTAGFVMRPANAGGVCTKCLLAGEIEGAGIVPDPTELIFNGTFEGIEQAGETVRQVTYTVHMKAQGAVDASGGFDGEGVLEFRGAGRGVAYEIPVRIDSATDGSNLLITFASTDSEGTLPPINVGNIDSLYQVNPEGARLAGSFSESTTSAKSFEVVGPASFES